MRSHGEYGMCGKQPEQQARKRSKISLSSEYTGSDVHLITPADILSFSQFPPQFNSMSDLWTTIQINVLVKTSPGATVAVKAVTSPGGGCAVFYHDDEKGHIIIGEAAVSMAVAGLDITAEFLINELGVMAEGDVSDARLEEIFDARRWLQGFRKYSSREQAEMHWMTGLEKDG